MLMANSALREEPASQTPGASALLHVAIIMDGNGRWAAARGLPRIEGHRRGIQSVKNVLEACPDLGIGRLTLYAFSTENWRRPADEVRGLMGLFRQYLRRESAELVRRGVRIRFIGERSNLEGDLIESMNQLERDSEGGTQLALDVALNYGARAEIAAAARSLARKVARGELPPEAVNEAALEAELFTYGASDPDLVIRTSGEQRLSNFLLWQAAYSEFYFAKTHWPDFDRVTLEQALENFRARDRRFGALSR